MGYFLSSIHNNAALSDSQKFSYLKLSMHADLSKINQSIPINEANYAIAWNLLRDRFTTKRDKIFAHLNCFMSIPLIQIENSSSVLKLEDSVTEGIMSLEVLEQKTERFSEITFAYSLIHNLDYSYKLWWERKYKADELPKVEQLISFLTMFAPYKLLNTASQKIYKQK